MTHNQDSNCKVWAKGDPCLSPYSGDDKLYRAVIKRIHRSPVGHLTATVKYHGYSDEEEVEVARLQEIKVKERESTVKKSRPAASPGMFKPLSGGEADERMKEKYGGLDEQTEIKSEKLSAELFSKKKKSSVTMSQKASSSQGKERKKGIVAIGGEAISRSRSPAVGRKMKDKSTKIDSDLKIDIESSSDGEEAVHVTCGRKRMRKDIVATVGEALDRDQKLPTSRKISDISSVLDPDSVHDALNGRYNMSAKQKTATVSENMEEGAATDGFDEDDLEKPKFSFKPEGAKVPYTLSEKGQEPVVQVPATINQYLRDYQREGIKFLYTHYTYNQGAILGDDMGLGKTVQVIGFLAALLGKQGNRIDVMRQKPKFIRKLSDSSAVRQDSGVTSPFLIIGPGCVLYNWLEELETWGYFTVRKFHGASKNECLSDIKKGKVEIVVTTFETFREHQGILNKIQWEAVIADEVHKIKGLKAQTTKALRSINTRRRYGLTGTALQNNLLELWCILDWAQPGCLGRLADFQEEYVRPIELGQRHDANKRELAQARKRKERFAEIRKGMMIRRMKSLISEQLPKKDDNVVFCRLSQLQTSIYKTILDHPNMDLVLHMEDPCGCDSGIPQSKCCKKKTPDGHSVKALMFTFMHLLLKVSNHVAMLVPKNNTSEQQNRMARKICEVAFEKHPGFVNQTREASFQTLSDPKYCGKMKILQGLLKVFYKDHSQVLVFSYSTQALDIIEQYLMTTGYEFRRIDGSVSSKKRQIIVREFNSDPNIFVCLISTKAGGLGLNLTGANRVIIFDPNWNPTHDLQAQDRAYRIGQRRNVQVYRLVSAGTIEENMYLRQIYKQQLLNVSVEDENARRYFYAVQGNKHQKGELFGVKNMFQLHTGKSCLTVDILKRNERVESALAGFEMTKYVPPVVRLEEDDDYEDLDDLQKHQKDTSESEEDVFAQFFSSQEANDNDKDSAANDEVDAISDNSDDDDMLLSSDNSDSSEDLLVNESRKRKSNKSHGNVKRPVKERNQISEDSDDSDMLDDFGNLIDDDHISPKQQSSDRNKQPGSHRKRKLNVTFKSPEPYNSDSTRKGKVRPSQSRTGKGPVKQGKGAGSGGDLGKGSVRKGRRASLEEQDGSFRVDQTLAGSFSDVGDVFENCGVVHIHENVKVVGGSRAEDHMSKCAMNDVYELHQNSQDLAVQCDPLSESSEDEAPPSTSKRKEPVSDLNASRSVVIDNLKVLIGQTPRGIRLKQFEKMSKENQSANLTEFAELVLSLTEGERMDLLNKQYGVWEPKLKDILTGTQQSEMEGPEKSKRSERQRKPKQSMNPERKVKRRARKLDQSLAGVVYEDTEDSESLPQPTSTMDGDIGSDDGSDMDVGVSPVKRRKPHILNQSRSKPKRTPGKKHSDHVQIPPSYMDYPVSDQDISENDEKRSSPSKRKKTKLKEKSPLKPRVSENQLDCMAFDEYDSVDSSDLYREMAKMSQADVKANMDEIGKESSASQRKYGDRNSNCDNDKISTNNNTNKTRSVGVHRHTDSRSRDTKDCAHSKSSQCSGSKSEDNNQNSSANSRTKLRNSKQVDESDNSQVSVLDDIFGSVGAKLKSKRKPAPSKHKTTKDLNNTRRIKNDRNATRDSEKDGAKFKALDEIFCSIDSDSEMHLETSTLKDDDHDCFDDPRKWRKRKQKTTNVHKGEMSAVDKLISESEADFNNLFTAGKMRRKERNTIKEKESSSVKSCDRSASLFSF